MKTVTSEEPCHFISNDSAPPLSFTIGAAVTKTAYDALQAKYSAVVLAEYYPKLRCKDGGGDAYLYSSLLGKMVQFVNTKQDNNQSLISENRLKSQQLLDRNKTNVDTRTKELPIIHYDKRQSPLVNLGYAFRVSCILFQIESFLMFHQRQTAVCSRSITSPGSETSHTLPVEPGVVQIVFLGAGLDVTGMWCLNERSFNDSLCINIIEVDSESICQVKKEAIQQNLTEFDWDNELSVIDGVVLHGLRRRCTKFSKYTLLSCDLRCTSQLEKLLVQSSSAKEYFNTSIPTLVVSELVISYLLPCEQDIVLQWFAKNLGHIPTTCSTFYEPLSPKEARTDDHNSMQGSSQPILQEYKRSYYDQFIAKLGRGNHSLSPSYEKSAIGDYDNVHKNIANGLIYPVGTSCDQIVEQKLLHKAGFSRASAVMAGTACFFQGLETSNRWTAKEQFAEHAALVLHLSSYSVACAFGYDPTASSETLNLHQATHTSNSTFVRMMCPWMSGIHPQFNVTRDKTLDNECNISCSYWITDIQQVDEKQVRDLFSTLYEHLFVQYPSIRKMVKTALRKDLGVAIDETSGITISSQKSLPSVIGVRYRHLGGYFIVATQYGRENLDKNSRLNSSSSDAARQILGGIGIRRCSKAEEKQFLDSLFESKNDTRNVHIYEIQRLFVHSCARSKGIGGTLLDVACSLIRERSKNEKATCIIIATTPIILENANKFYQSNGFSIHKEVSTGDLILRTFWKDINAL